MTATSADGYLSERDSLLQSELGSEIETRGKTNENDLHDDHDKPQFIIRNNNNPLPCRITRMESQLL